MDESLFDEYKNTNFNNKCIKSICCFDKNGIEDAISKVKKYEFIDNNKTKRLWALWGQAKNTKGWICLEVGSSKEIKKEILEDLKLMISNPKKIKKSSAFYSDVFEYTTYMDKASCKYRAIHEMCDKFEWFEIDADRFLEGTELNGYDKVNYAEVKYACEMKALLWNPSPAFNGNQEIEIFNSIKNNSKIEIMQASSE